MTSEAALAMLEIVGGRRADWRTGGRLLRLVET